MIDHRSPRPCLIVLSRSAPETIPSSTNLKASLRRATCSRFRTKPLISLLRVITSISAASRRSFARDMVSIFVSGAPDNSTIGNKYGGFAG